MPQSRKILVLVSSLGGGGAERVATHLCNAWHADGHNVTLMTTFAGDTSVGYPLAPGIKQSTLPPSTSRPGKTLWHQLQRLMALRTTLRSERPDLVVSFLTNVNVATVIAALGLGVRVVVCERIFPPLFPLTRTWSFLRRLTYPLAHRVVVQTRASEQWFSQTLSRARTTVIPNPLVLPMSGSGPELSIDPPIASNDRLVLAVGRLDEQKGFMDLAQAFASVCERAAEWQLVVLGEGPQRPALARKIAELGLSDRVHLPGWAGNVDQWYRRADLFVLSSHFEGFPNALLEAMGHGVACISYDCPAGPADMIDHDHTGYLVPLAMGPAGLAAAMEKLMHDDTTRRAIAGRAVAAAQQYAGPRIFAQWSQLMDSGL